MYISIGYGLSIFLSRSLTMGCAASTETKRTGPEYGQYSMLGNYHQKQEEPKPQQQSNGGPPPAPVDDKLYHTDTEDEVRGGGLKM